MKKLRKNRRAYLLSAMILSSIVCAPAALNKAALAYAVESSAPDGETVLDISEYGPMRAAEQSAEGSTEGAAASAGSSGTSAESSAAISETAPSSAAAAENHAAGGKREMKGNAKNLASLRADSGTAAIGDLINSRYAIVYDLDAGRILAEKNADTVINPASMTKIMTILVCAERVSDLEKKLKITQEIVDFVHANDASNCGYTAGEEVSIRDLMYGIVLPSGADAVLALTRHIAGSDAGFVELMNQRARELGLSSSANFSNATGLYSSTHHLTVRDMAEVMNAAMKNPVAREILSAKTWKSSATNKQSEGKTFSNLFLRRIEDQSMNGSTVYAAKTGYVSQSMFCSASAGFSGSGKQLLVVTAYGSSTWQCIYDQAALYKRYSA